MVGPRLKDDPDKKVKGTAISRKKDAETAEVKKERVRKAFELPGQTKDTPEETDSLRKFYTSLRQQIPSSVMAEKWLLQHGLFPEDEAQAIFKGSLSSKGGLKSPAKTPRPRAASNGTAAARKTASQGIDVKAPRPRAVNGKPAAKQKQVKEEADADDGYSDAPLAKRSKPTARKPVAKGANQAAKPQKRKRAASTEDEDSDESEDDDSDYDAVEDDIVPSKKPKGVDRPPAKQLSGKASLKSQGSGKSAGKVKKEPQSPKAQPAPKAGLDDYDSSDDDKPLAARV